MNTKESVVELARNEIDALNKVTKRLSDVLSAGVDDRTASDAILAYTHAVGTLVPQDKLLYFLEELAKLKVVPKPITKQPNGAKQPQQLQKAEQPKRERYKGQFTTTLLQIWREVFKNASDIKVSKDVYFFIRDFGRYLVATRTDPDPPGTLFKLLLSTKLLIIPQQRQPLTEQYEYDEKGVSVISPMETYPLSPYNINVDRAVLEEFYDMSYHFSAHVLELIIMGNKAGLEHTEAFKPGEYDVVVKYDNIYDNGYPGYFYNLYPQHMFGVVGENAINKSMVRYDADQVARKISYINNISEIYQKVTEQGPYKNVGKKLKDVLGVHNFRLTIFHVYIELAKTDAEKESLKASTKLQYDALSFLLDPRFLLYDDDDDDDDTVSQLNSVHGDPTTAASKRLKVLREKSTRDGLGEFSCFDFNIREKDRFITDEIRDPKFGDLDNRKLENLPLDFYKTYKSNVVAQIWSGGVGLSSFLLLEETVSNQGVVEYAMKCDRLFHWLHADVVLQLVDHVLVYKRLSDSGEEKKFEWRILKTAKVTLEPNPIGDSDDLWFTPTEDELNELIAFLTKPKSDINSNVASHVSWIIAIGRTVNNTRDLK